MTNNKIEVWAPDCDYDDLIGYSEDTLRVSDFSKEQDYHFKSEEPKDLHLLRVEKTLAHQLHCGSHCRYPASDEFISQIPKKASGKLRQNEKYGYGLHSRQGLAIYKLIIANAITQVPLWGFAVYWLVHYPCYMLALVTAVIGLADYYDKQSR